LTYEWPLEASRAGFLAEKHSVGNGDRGAPKIREKYFSGNYYVEFGHFSGKNHVKFVNFVNFSEKFIKIRVFC